MPPKKCFAFIENLPLCTTKKDLFEVFNKYGRIIFNHIFRIKHEGSVFDFQSALLQFDVDTPSFDSISKNTIKIGGRQLKVTVRESINDIKSVGILFDVDPLEFNNEIKDKLSNLGAYNINQILFPSSNGKTSYIFSFNNQFSLSNARSSLPDNDIELLLPEETQHFSVPCEQFQNISHMKDLFDFYLIHFGVRYGVIRSIASSLSSTIANSETNFVLLPDIVGPIDLIVDFLLLQPVRVPSESEHFFLSISEFLGINYITQRVSFSYDMTLRVSNAIALSSTATTDEELTFICKFIALHLDYFVTHGTISSIPMHIAERVMSIASIDSVTHDSLLSMIEMVCASTSTKLKYLLKYIDISKLSRDRVSRFLLEGTININDIREFLVKLIE